MEYLHIALTFIVIVPISDAIIPKCPIGTCCLRWSENCTVKADTISVDGNEIFCHGHGVVIAKVGLEKPFCDCFSSYSGIECEFNYTLKYNCNSSDECNGGDCIGSTCTNCRPGWRGQMCEIETLTNLSQRTLCENGGTPFARGKLTGCLCPCGFTGDTCSKMTRSVTTDPACDIVMCGGKGSCKVNLDTETAYCQCFSSNFYGQFCQYSGSETTTKSPNPACQYSYECIADRDCPDSTRCRTVDPCGSRKCKELEILELESSSTQYTLEFVIVTSVFFFLWMMICAVFSRNYYQRICGQYLCKTRAHDQEDQTAIEPGGMVPTTSGTHGVIVGSSSGNEEPPSYDEVFEKPPSYADVANGYKAMFQHPSTRISSISDCIHL